MHLQEELKSIKKIEHQEVSFSSTLYRCKIITAGTKQQVYNYSKPLFKDYEVEREPVEKRKKGVKRSDNIQRTRNQLVLLIDSNVSRFSKFLTLTFADTILDRKKAFDRFNRFQKDFNKTFDEPLKYVAVIEHQKKRGIKEKNEGSLHFHLVVFNEQKLPFKTLKSIWGKYGSLDIKKIDTVSNIGRYMAKYLSKEVMQLNSKGYSSSQNLKQPYIEYLPYNLEVAQTPNYSNTYSLYTTNQKEQNECTFTEYKTPIYIDPFIRHAHKIFGDKMTVSIK